jgi:uncharacterized protein
MIVIDTSILLYAANRTSEFHKACKECLDKRREGSSPWYLSWPICYEFLRVITHPATVAKPWTLTSGWRFLEPLIDCPSAHLLSATPRHEAVLTEVISEIPHLRGNILHDLHTAVLMREHGIRDIYTRDVDFHRFPFVKVIDPVA